MPCFQAGLKGCVGPVAVPAPRLRSCRAGLPALRCAHPQRARHAVALKATAEGAQDRKPQREPPRALAACIGAFAVAFALAVAPLPSSAASDPAKVGTCLLKSCQTQLAGCIGDINCLEDLICLNTCNGRPDEKECQIKCGDQYEDKAVQAFNACAVSEKQCVPQQVTENAYPVPPDSSLDKSFDVNAFQGRWYITAGYNSLFDIFDCQEHFWNSPEQGKTFGKINWRIPKGNGDFFERSVVQRFVQDEENPAKLYNHGNEYLHYEDDWYVAAWKPDEYAFIYYKGNNDAWRGYGGATVYTRASSFPPEYAAEMQRAAESVGLKWEDFTLTDNTCKPHPANKRFSFNIFSGVQQLEATLEDDLKSFSKGFTTLETNIVRTLTEDEKEVEREISEAANYLNRMQKRNTKQPGGGPMATITTPFIKQQCQQAQ